jgi:hypothetical protein
MLKAPKWDTVSSHEVKERIRVVYTAGTIARAACACMDVMMRQSAEEKPKPARAPDMDRGISEHLTHGLGKLSRAQLLAHLPHAGPA